MRPNRKMLILHWKTIIFDILRSRWWAVRVRRPPVDLASTRVDLASTPRQGRPIGVRAKMSSLGSSMVAPGADMWLIEKPWFYNVKPHFLHLGFAKVVPWSVNRACWWPLGTSAASLSRSSHLLPTQNELLGSAPWVFSLLNMQICGSSKNINFTL